MVKRTRTSWVLALLATAPLSGCFDDGVLGPPLGPLEVRVLDHKVHDLYNVTIVLSFVNTGATPLTKIDAGVQPSATQPGSDNLANGRVTAYPGRYFDARGIFNHTDRLMPGVPWNVTLPISFDPAQAITEIEPGDVYTILVAAEFQDAETRWTWEYHLPCFDEHDREVAPEGVWCDKYVSFHSVPAEPLDRRFP